MTLLSSLFLLSWSLLAQQEERLDHVYLAGGNYLQGKVIDTVDQQFLKFSLSTDSLLLIPMNLIDRIEPAKTSRLRHLQGRSVQAGGFFWELSGQLLSARTSFSDEFRHNISLQFNGGFFVKPWLSLGAGFSIDQYEEYILPVFSQIRLYVPERATAPYLSFQLGRGIPIQKFFDREEFEDSRGGWMYYPAIGLRIASRRAADFHLDVGYKFQQATEEFNFPIDWWTTNATERLTYKSFVLRMGCTF